MTERHGVVVDSALQANQLREYLKASGIRWQMDMQGNVPLRHRTSTRTFTVEATPEQWAGIDEWLQRTRVDRPATTLADTGNLIVRVPKEES